MNNPIEVTVKNGAHAGKEGFYDADAKVRNGRVCVMFKTANMSGAFIAIEDLAPIIEETKEPAMNERAAAYLVITKTNSFKSWDFMAFISKMKKLFLNSDCIYGHITDQKEFTKFIWEQAK